MFATQEPAARPHACERDGAHSRLNHLLDSATPKRLRLVAAMAYETGIGLRDICELRLTSFDLLRRQIGVQDVDGLHTWYYVFGTSTLTLLAEWLRVRDPGMDDGVFGLLLHDEEGAPCTPDGLTAEFTQFLACVYSWWDDHPEGRTAFEIEELYA